MNCKAAGFMAPVLIKLLTVTNLILKNYNLWKGAEMKRIDEPIDIRNDYFTRKGIIQPLSLEQYHSIDQDDVSRDELIHALYLLGHNPRVAAFGRVCLILAAGLIAYALLHITNVQL